MAALVNLKTGKETIVADPQKENVRDIEFGKMEQWKFTASDGTEIDGYFCLPPGFDPQKKYPMIVYYYGALPPPPQPSITYTARRHSRHATMWCIS